MRSVRSFSLVLWLLGAAVVPVAAQAPADTSAHGPQAVYAVAQYDPARDPAQDLAAAVEQAHAGGKRILLEIGGDWCTWCHALDRYIHENAAVAAALAEGFLILKVNYSPENKNEAFLSQYPKVQGYPHFFVLEQDGTFLHSQGTGELEQNRSYDEQVFLAFLAEWAPQK